MIAYNEKELDRLSINQDASLALERKLISKDEYEAINNAHPVVLYSPNIFIRIGLFLVTVVIVLMSYGLLLIPLGGLLSSNGVWAAVTIIFGLLTYTSLEWLIYNKRHYRSGVDDALLWLSLGHIIGAAGVFMNFSELGMSILILVLSSAATVRFANSVMSAVMFSSFIAIIFYSLTPLGSTAKFILPFVIMVVSILIYWMISRIKHKNKLRHYRYCFKMWAFLSLITLYVSVNYFAVRELTIQLFGLQLPEGASIPGGWFFWFTTIVIPPLYIMRALQTKDSLMLRTGMLLLVATVFTIRYYYSVAPVEEVMTAGGVILIVAAYFIIKYLRTPKSGITDQEPEYEDHWDALQLEAITIAETFQKSAPPAEGGFRFGGGSSGGGGASGEY